MWVKKNKYRFSNNSGIRNYAASGVLNKFILPVKNIFAAVIFLFLSLYLLGCTDLFSNPSSQLSLNDRIKVTINNPVANDTIGFYGTNISYNLKTDVGINFIELYVNGVINKWNPPNSDGSQPTIPLTVDSAMIGQRISYFMVYYDKDGLWTVSDTIKSILIKDVTPPPYKPYGVSLLHVSSGVMNISWNDSTQRYSPGFEIWRKVGYYGHFVLYLSAAPGSTNINDDNYVDTTVYYYTVKALNKYGYAFSDTINTYGAGATHSIAPPTNVQLVAGSYNVVRVTWVNNIQKENYLKIERRYPWSSFEKIGTVVKGSTAFTDSANGLVPNQTYIYRIKAVSSNDSSWSNEESVVTPSQQ